MNMSNSKPWRDRQTLERLHHDEEMYIAQIARELGCTPQTISRWLDKHGIEKRSHDTRGSAGSDHHNHKEAIDHREYGSEWENRRAEYRKDHEIVCQKCGSVESETTDTFHIHHINESDGRETNAANVPNSALVPLCPSCHIAVEVNGFSLDGD